VSADLYLDDDTGLLALQFQARRSGLVVVRSDDVGMRGARDADHLRFASSQGMILVSCNVRDFRILHSEWLQRGESHAGILLANPEVPAGERVRRLLFIATVAEPGDFANQISWLRDWA
jgi:hypothetical protein